MVSPILKTLTNRTQLVLMMRKMKTQEMSMMLIQMILMWIQHISLLTWNMKDWIVCYSGSKSMLLSQSWTCREVLFALSALTLTVQTPSLKCLTDQVYCSTPQVSTHSSTILPPHCKIFKTHILTSKNIWTIETTCYLQISHAVPLNPLLM